MKQLFIVDSRMSLGAYAMRQLWPDEGTIVSQDPLASGSSLTDYPGMFNVGFKTKGYTLFWSLLEILLDQGEYNRFLCVGACF